MLTKNLQKGFTLVELLIVVVVIAILAAVAIVAYSGITSRANVSVLKSDLSNAVKRLKVNQVSNGVNTYPATLELAVSAGLSASQGVDYQYVADNNATPPTFCLTASRSGVSYYTTQDGVQLEGACPGHIVGGVPPEEEEPEEPEGPAPITFESISMNQVISAGNRAWRGIASSADGNKVAAVVNSGYIYTSTDAGATWQERQSAGSRAWTKIASSDDGTKLAAITGSQGVGIYISTDSGATWSARTGLGQSGQQWSGIAMSADGTIMYASSAKQLGVTDGCMYKSTDSGATWAATAGVNCSFSWSDVATSADGTRVLGARSTNLQRSTNGGTSWTNLTGSPYIAWYRLAMSDDGTKMYAATQSADVYSSMNGGTAWAIMSGLGTGSWMGLATSNDGSKVLAARISSALPYTSIDSGANWIARSDNVTTGSWYGAASSADGSIVYFTRSTSYMWKGVYQ